MKSGARKVPRLGDVIEIPTPGGLAYLQYTHDHQRYGALVRILPGLFETRPGEISTLVQQRERFVVFFPLRAAVRQGIVEIVSSEPIPEPSVPFPLFRARGAIKPGTNRVLWWALWDGQAYHRLGELSPEQRDLPIVGIWNDTLLAERIASGWSPKDDV
jgi:hypothetical protein